MAKTKKSKEDRLIQQRLCKRRRYAEIKSDPKLYEIEKEKQKMRYLKRKAEKKIVSVAEKSPVKQKLQRKKWKENSKRYRQRKAEESKQKLPDPIRVEAVPEDTEKREPNKISDPLKGVGNRVYTSHEVSLIVKKIRNKELKKQKKMSDIIKKLVKQNAMYRMREHRRLEKREEFLNDDTPNIKNFQLKNQNTIKKPPAFKRTKNSFREIDKLHPEVLENAKKDVVESIHRFYNDDCNSVIRAGKKEFITKNKIRNQKRFLTASLKELYKKFIAEQHVKVSYSFFCKQRPFWVLFPKQQDKDRTCLCLMHTNMDLLVEALHKAQILKPKNSKELLKTLCCDIWNPECLERTCAACKKRVPEYMEFSNDLPVTYYEWKRVTKEITTNKGIKKKQQMTSKEKEEEEPLNLIQKLDKALPKFFSHSYNMVKQYAVMKNLRENLRFDEAMIHVDFSENYALKYAEEVQSFHFGGNRCQVALHTSVIYTQDFSTGAVKPTCMCTVTNCTRHDVPAIWAHLIPLLKEAFKLNPFIETIHFLSDSPSSQYRNKYMFYVISQLSKDFHQIKRVTWNYSESGHGKGAPDGIGSVLKRTADDIVRYGEDVGNFSDFCNVINNRINNIVIKAIEEIDVLEKEKKILNDLKPFRGTFAVHQVIWDKYHKQTTLRSISCFLCDAGEVCHHNKHLGFIQNKETVHEPTDFDDYDLVIPLSQIRQPNKLKTDQEMPSCCKQFQKENIKTTPSENKEPGTNEPSCSKTLDKPKIKNLTKRNYAIYPDLCTKKMETPKTKLNPEGKSVSMTKNMVRSDKSIKREEKEENKISPRKRIQILSDITIKEANQPVKKKKN